MHHFSLRVYYEDTDLGGIVYYANYLKFIERARSDWVRTLGVDQTTLQAEQGLVFAVRHIEADYLAAARFDDQLVVETAPEAVTGARVQLHQTVRRGETVLFDSRITLVCIGKDGRAARIPAKIRQSFQAAIE